MFGGGHSYGVKKKQEIIKLAESRIREGGYNHFSFREIAAEIGIKSASVHYYFPTKADLGVAVAKAYTKKFLDGLGAPVDLVKEGKKPLHVYVDAFRQALTVDRKMCLCGILAAEADGIPEQVVVEANNFIRANIEWLSAVFLLAGELDAELVKDRAIQTLALLEGAMMVSNVTGDEENFERAVRYINNLS